ncbi:MAG TPA: hypothetical protein PKY25_01275 [Bacilli bacterium]|nr:hypothetical protein [Bacilli bacterium]
MNNEKDMIDDILDESLSTTSKPQTSSNFQMPTDITEAYNKSVSEITESKKPLENNAVPQNIIVDNATKQIEPTAQVIQAETVTVTPPVDNTSVQPQTTVIEPNQSIPTVEIQPAALQQTTSIEQNQITPQPVQQVAEQTSVLPVVENSVIPEKPIKKKGKVMKIIVLSILLLITLSALATYIIGVDTIINFIKSFI